MISTIADQLLHFTSHRPFPLPDKQWLIYQQWKDVLFLHSPFPPEVIKPLLPPGLEPDIISGYAWLSVVLFAVTDVRMRLLPVVPLLPAFNELNLRTYVQYDDVPGIYFLQIKANSAMAVLMNRMATKLRYQFANVHKPSANRYYMPAASASNMLDIDFTPGLFFNPMPIPDRWLTERYCCYQEDGGKMYRYNIHHPAWLLYHVQINYYLLRFNFQNLQLTDQSASLLHYSPLQSALIWRRDRIA